MACPACEGADSACEVCGARRGSTVPCDPPTIPAPTLGARDAFDVEIVRLDSPPTPLVIELPDFDS